MIKTLFTGCHLSNQSTSFTIMSNSNHISSTYLFLFKSLTIIVKQNEVTRVMWSCFYSMLTILFACLLIIFKRTLIITSYTIMNECIGLMKMFNQIIKEWKSLYITISKLVKLYENLFTWTNIHEHKTKVYTILTIKRES